MNRRRPESPLFSIIVPLENHQGMWERCLLGWQAQTVPRSQYEVILVMPPDFPVTARTRLAALLGAQDRIEDAAGKHNVGLYVVGAAAARGKFLFFTESHCWPEPDVLEKCAKRFATDRQLAGFSCRTIRVTSNRLSEVVANMYEDSIKEGMIPRPWLNVVNQCFVTRRGCYIESGGYNPEFGTFSEWVLGANYFAFGHRLGYEPDILFHHYYMNRLTHVEQFTREFIDGETRYFANPSPGPGGHLLDRPPEWTCQGGSNRRLARSLLRIATLDAIAPRPAAHAWRRIAVKAIARWLPPAAFGMWASRMLAALNVRRTYLSVAGARLIGSKAWLDTAFKTYMAAVIHHQRLVGITKAARNEPPPRGQARGSRASGWDLAGAGNAGFYPVETSHDVTFRWSETAAVLSAWMPAGRHRIHIDYLPVRPLDDGTTLRFYVNERPVENKDVAIGPDSIDIAIDLPRSGIATLAWFCRPFPAAGDPRRLGIPIQGISSQQILEQPRSQASKSF